MPAKLSRRAAVSRKRPTAIPGALETARLANGLEVVLLRNAQAPVVSTALCYRAGARDEAAGASGTAHFLEHMMFKGSALYGPGEVDRRTQAQGGSNNAFTSHDVTAYWFSFAADRWGEALTIEADRMRGLRLDPAEVDSERQVIEEEIAMYEDDPWDSLELAVQQRLFGAHPYARSVLGTAEALAGVGSSELAEFHRRHYRPDNAVLVIAGDLGDDALALVETAFGDLAPGGDSREVLAPPVRRDHVARLERKKGELARFELALPAPPLDDPEHAPLRLAATLLADGRASRLQRALVEEGQLCLGTSVSLADNVLASSTTVAADLLPGSEVADVEARVGDELARLREDLVDDAELERARRVFFADWVHGVERIHEQALVAGLAAALHDLAQPERLLKEIAAVTPRSLRAAAARWFDPTQGSVVGVHLPER